MDLVSYNRKSSFVFEVSKIADKHEFLYFVQSDEHTDGRTHGTPSSASATLSSRSHSQNSAATTGVGYLSPKTACVLEQNINFKHQKGVGW